MGPSAKGFFTWRYIPDISSFSYFSFPPPALFLFSCVHPKRRAGGDLLGILCYKGRNQGNLCVYHMHGWTRGK